MATFVTKYVHSAVLRLKSEKKFNGRSPKKRKKMKKQFFALFSFFRSKNGPFSDLDIGT